MSAILRAELAQRIGEKEASIRLQKTILCFHFRGASLCHQARTRCPLRQAPDRFYQPPEWGEPGGAADAQIRGAAEPPAGFRSLGGRAPHGVSGEWF